MFPFRATKARRSIARRSVRAFPRFEELESRCLLSASPGSAIFFEATPNETNFSNGNMYGLSKIQAASAWDLTTGSQNVSVAVIDTGIDYTHPDLYLNVWINQTEVPTSKTFDAGLVDTNSNGRVDFYDLNSLDAQRNLVTDGFGNAVNAAFTSNTNDNTYIDAGDLLAAGSGWEDLIDGDGTSSDNGFVDDVVGWDFFAGDNDPMDGYGHGTHVSGTIGAIGNNGVGVVGVNWTVSLMALQIGDANGNLKYQAAVDAIYYASNNGARVSNNSWIVTGGKVGDPLYNALVYARNTDQDAVTAGIQGQLVVAAAGNYGFNNDKSPWKSYPASFDLTNIVSVMATDSKDATPRWTNYGKVSVDLGAPGVGILSTVPVSMGSYDVYSGTSMATPHVVGTAALLLARNSTLTTIDVKAAILNSVDKIASLSTKSVTGGRLNAFKALQSVSPGLTAIVATEQQSDTSSGSENNGSHKKAAVAAINRVLGFNNLTDPALAIALAMGSPARVGGDFRTTERRIIELSPGQPGTYSGVIAMHPALDGMSLVQISGSVETVVEEMPGSAPEVRPVGAGDGMGVGEMQPPLEGPMQPPVDPQQEKMPDSLQDEAPDAFAAYCLEHSRVEGEEAIAGAEDPSAALALGFLLAGVWPCTLAEERANRAQKKNSKRQPQESE